MTSTTVVPAPSATVELTAIAQRHMLRRLQAAWGGDGSVHWIETHISIVLLHAGHAYKFKKVLHNAFINQSTLSRRRRACDEELRLNRRLAPTLYLGVVQLSGSVAQPVLDGDGPTLDVAVRMRAFAAGDLWSARARAGHLAAVDIDALARRLALFHDEAAVAPPQGPLGTPAQSRQVHCDTLRSLQQHWRDADPRAPQLETLAVIDQWQTAGFERLAPLMRERLCEGRIRECHGDLHLGNVAQVDGVPTPFDGIDFSAVLRWIDVADEIAFLAMDLRAHGLDALAHRFIDRYLQGSGDYAAVPLIDLFAVHRALVRALVARLRGAQPGTGPQDECGVDYLALAKRLTAPRQPALLITHGLSGSGKTTHTQALLEASGALRVRADIERKRLAGLPELAHSDSSLRAGLYGASATRATYGRLLRAAAPALAAGWPVILDATFLRHWQRAAARRWAARQGIPFAVLSFEAEPAELLRRLRQRAASGGDASEADERVLDWQRRVAEPLRPDEATEGGGAGDARLFRFESNAAPDWSPVLAWLAAARGPRQDRD